MKKSFLLLFSFCFSFYLSAQEQYQSKAYLGVNTNHLSHSKAKVLNFKNTNGVYVTEVIENSAASKNGIQPFDYLTGINNKPFSSSQGFSHVMHDFKAGDQATIQIVRNGEAMSIPVTFGKQSDAIYRKIPKEEEPFFGVKQAHYNWKDNTPGVKVDIVKNSAAETLGLKDDDIITKINNQRIIDWHDLGNMVDNMKPGQTISVDYLRDGTEKSGTSIIKSYGQTYEIEHHNKKGKEQEEKKIADEIEEENDDDEIAKEDIPEILKNLDIEIDMEDLTQKEADDMKKEAGIDMPIINNLEIEKLNIFPNPNDGVFNLMFDLPNKGQTSVQIFNSTGRLIYQNDMQTFSGLFKDRIDISTNAKGIYFLAVIQNGKSITQKVIFQ